ncbi:MAG: hypothetical protein MI723_14700, partial [Caulobacterales bacterium]|nr:hypothetical protein [Caulobacterales bacterium]
MDLNFAYIGPPEEGACFEGEGSPVKSAFSRLGGASFEPRVDWSDGRISDEELERCLGSTAVLVNLTGVDPIIMMAASRIYFAEGDGPLPPIIPLQRRDDRSAVPACFLSDLIRYSTTSHVDRAAFERDLAGRLSALLFAPEEEEKAELEFADEDEAALAEFEGIDDAFGASQVNIFAAYLAINPPYSVAYKPVGLLQLMRVCVGMGEDVRTVRATLKTLARQGLVDMYTETGDDDDAVFALTDLGKGLLAKREIWMSQKIADVQQMIE